MIDWEEVQKDELIHGIVNDEVVFRMKREGDPPFIWHMTGLLDDRSQYRNDLKERAEIHLKNINKEKKEWVIRHPGTGEKIVRETFEECMEKDFEGFNLPFLFINGEREDFETANERVKNYFEVKPHYR